MHVSTAVRACMLTTRMMERLRLHALQLHRRLERTFNGPQTVVNNPYSHEMPGKRSSGSGWQLSASWLHLQPDSRLHP